MHAKPKISLRRYVVIIGQVARESFRMAPSAGIARLVDSVIRAALPIATTYFAALTTTALTDAYAGSQSAGDIALLYVFVTALLGVLTLAWGSVSSYISQKTRYVIGASVEDRMTEQFISLPFSMYDDKEVMDLYEKAKRFSNFFSYILDTISYMATSIVSAAGSLIALLFLNPWLAVAVLIAILPGLVIQVQLARRQTEHWDTNITNRRRMNNIGWSFQNSDMAEEMRMYGVARHLINTYARLREGDEKRRLTFELRSIWWQLAADIFESAIQLGALVWIVLQIIDRTQPVGQFVYVQQMVSRAIGQAGSLASQLGRIDQDLANIVDYQQFMELDTVAKRPKTLEKAPDIVSFSNVSFRYPKTDHDVLSDITLSVRRGQRIAVVGENGAGKSTFIKLLTGLYDPTKGQVLLDNAPLSRIETASWHKYIAMLSQDYAVYNFATIKENITLGDIEKPITNEQLTKAINNAEFESVISPLKHGVDTFVNRWMAEDSDETTATELSGGQYQRLALARNFYRDSPFIILDEPTSAIDALAESRIFKHLFGQKDKTIITVSHRLTTIEKADVVYMLENGCIVEQGTTEELIGKYGAFYRMFESQIK